MSATDPLAYLRGFNRGWQDALWGRPPLSLATLTDPDFRAGYRDAYRSLIPTYRC